MQKKIRTNNIMAVLLAAALLLLAAPAMAEPQTPFVIDGYVSESDGDPCNDPWVRVTNTNTSASWDADNSSTSNYYRLVLDSDDVGEGDVLRFDALRCSQSTILEYTVLQDDINSGGFELDVTHPPAPIPELATIALFAVGLVMLLGYMRLGRRD